MSGARHRRMSEQSIPASRRGGNKACDICGELFCASPSFCAACRTADWKRRAEGEPNVPRNRPTPQTLVEALMFGLRRGVAELNQRDTLRRLSEINEAQLLEVAERARKFKPHIAPAWEPDELEVLLRIWTMRHGC
jgi:hypothetical protein